MDPPAPATSRRAAACTARSAAYPGRQAGRHRRLPWRTASCSTLRASRRAEPTLPLHLLTRHLVTHRSCAAARAEGVSCSAHPTHQLHLHHLPTVMHPTPARSNVVRNAVGYSDGCDRSDSGDARHIPDERVCTDQGWSRLGESNPGPAHYEETGPRLLRRQPATTVTDLTPLGAPAAPFDLSSHHV